MTTPRVCYYGCWGTLGHYTYTDRGARATDIDGNTRHPLWLLLCDDYTVGDPALGVPSVGKHFFPGRKLYFASDEKHQPQGKARVTLHHGWTLMAFWDRSGDSRFGSYSIFLAEGVFSFDEMVAFASARFPSVWQRITSAFKVELAYVELPTTEAGVTS